MRFVSLLFLCSAAAFAQSYDILLEGGRVIDPRNGIDAVRDVAVQGGRIAAIEADIPAASAKQAINLSGLYVTPGLVDIHFHAFAGPLDDTTSGGNRSIYPDLFAPRTCTTTVVDPGSSGWRRFDEFRKTIVETAQTRTLVMLNIVGAGIASYAQEQNVHDMDAAKTAELARKHSDVVVGIKSAHWWGKDFTSVEKAVEAGKLADIPVMVDFGYFLPERPYETMISDILRPGDMSTHFYRWPAPLLDESGKPRQYLRLARGRGVKFDVGHGGGSFHFRNAVPMVQAGFYPDSISTDAHLNSVNGPMMDMPAVMSKFLVMGMHLTEVIRASTTHPAEQVKRPQLGQIAVGAEADIALFDLETGNFTYRDVLGGTITGKQRFSCEMTMRAGKVLFDRGSRTGVPWERADQKYPAR
jgi:dihydroorotase